MYFIDTKFLSQITSKHYRGRQTDCYSWSPHSPYFNPCGHFLWDTNCTENCVYLRTKNVQSTNFRYYFFFIFTPVPCISTIYISTNKCTKPIYYINIVLHNCTHSSLRHVSTSVRLHQGAHLFLPKITCVTSVVIDY